MGRIYNRLPKGKSGRFPLAEDAKKRKCAAKGPLRSQISGS